MRRTVSFVALLSLLHAAPALTQQPSPLAPLGWMAGCWEQRSGARVIAEQWMAPAGGLMMGMSRTLVRDSAVEFEQLRIEVRQGVPTYIADPSGQAEASFQAILTSDTAVVFTNPQHDFPTRIGYRRAGPDSVIARIEGPQGGTTRRIDFPMRRVRCGS